MAKDYIDLEKRESCKRINSFRKAVDFYHRMGYNESKEIVRRR